MPRGTIGGGGLTRGGGIAVRGGTSSVPARGGGSTGATATPLANRGGVASNLPTGGGATNAPPVRGGISGTTPGRGGMTGTLPARGRTTANQPIRGRGGTQTVPVRGGSTGGGPAGRGGPVDQAPADPAGSSALEAAYAKLPGYTQLHTKYKNIEAQYKHEYETDPEDEATLIPIIKSLIALVTQIDQFRTRNAAKLPANLRNSPGIASYKPLLGLYNEALQREIKEATDEGQNVQADGTILPGPGAPQAHSGTGAAGGHPGAEANFPTNVYPDLSQLPGGDLINYNDPAEEGADQGYTNGTGEGFGAEEGANQGYGGEQGAEGEYGNEGYGEDAGYEDPNAEYEQGAEGEDYGNEQGYEGEVDPAQSAEDEYGATEGQGDFNTQVIPPRRAGAQQTAVA